VGERSERDKKKSTEKHLRVPGATNYGSYKGGKEVTGKKKIKELKVDGMS